MPESALNAAVGAVTPMSYATAAVSELDTPTSSGSREEEYYKLSTGGNGGVSYPGVVGDHEHPCSEQLA